ncbi:NAD(P)/FAD-dependent oxidoreductase [Stappia stellulata]|uniref:NAD(P)/FAD-dependent oxidoreductase n=1 Tax=Stappia stellulata TaxID=71235 RepID=UPI0003F8753E|nr:FAD-dependent oxidoreductase [Stappia stellulata]
MTELPSVHIVGAGIVGLAIAATLQTRGHQVTLIERNEPGSGASLGNASGIAWTDVAPLASPGVWRKAPGWLLDPLGPLSVRPSYAPSILPWMLRFLSASRPSAFKRSVSAIAALNADALPAWERLWRDTGTGGRLRAEGCLDVFDKPAEIARARAGWQLQRDHGIEVKELDARAIREMEPDLGPGVAGGAFLPGWAHLDDPHAMCLDLERVVRERGGQILRGDVVSVIGTDGEARLQMRDGPVIQADKVVIACGAWSRPLAASLGEDVPLDTERGYNITVPEPGVSFRRFIMLAGYGFVMSPIARGLRIGGMVEFAGLKAPPNWARVDALVSRARRIAPSLSVEGGERWMGFRPSLPDSLPVISRSRRAPQVYYAFGHAHHGLTQAATTGELVAGMISGNRREIDLVPYAVDRF